MECNGSSCQPTEIVKDNRRVRSSVKPPNPATVADFMTSLAAGFSEEHAEQLGSYLKTFDAKDGFLIDVVTDENGGVAVIFGSPDGFQRVVLAEHIFGDGTFKVRYRI